jgi:hypothetical protein
MDIISKMTTVGGTTTVNEKAFAYQMTNKYYTPTDKFRKSLQAKLIATDFYERDPRGKNSVPEG